MGDCQPSCSVNNGCNTLKGVSLEHETHKKCPQCFSVMMQPISFKSSPNVLVFEINSRNIKISKTLKFEQEGETSVATVMTDVFQKNGIMVSRTLAKIVRIFVFVDIGHIKNRGVIYWPNSLISLIP
jgi:mRNA degradation ribonuclease J1/J2